MRLTGLTPTEFTMLFTGSALLAVIFYLLSFRRRLALVAADPIWRKVVGRRRTPFRKLLALLGQLFILFLLALALADPRIPPEGSEPPVASVVVVDTSASMGTQEDQDTRLAQAREVVRAIADELGPRDRMLLMAMDDSCRPLSSFSADASTLRAAAEKLQSSGMNENPHVALNFARSALQGEGIPAGARRRVVLVSDRFHELPSGALPEDTTLVQVAVGEATENLAVTAFDVSSRGGAAAGSELFAEVTNYGKQTRTARLGIHTPESLLGEENLRIPAGERVSRSYFLKPLDGERVMATLTASHGGGSVDAFPVDDRAYAMIPKRSGRKVLLVTNGNLYLSRALSLNPSIQLETLPTSRFRPTALAGYRAAVFDGVCPPSPVPAAYFNIPAQTDCPFGVGDSVNFPKLLPLRGDHPVTEGITLVDMQIQAARRLVPQAGDVELLADERGPLIIARNIHGVKRLGVGFDVARSDLPLRIAFPIMLHNVLSWFVGEAGDDNISEASVGGIVELPAWVGPRTRVTGPAGLEVTPRQVGSRWLFRPRAPGYYEAREGRKNYLVPVNYHLEDESDLIGDRRGGQNRLRWSADGGAGGDEVLASLVSGFDKTEHPEPPLQWPLLLLCAAWLLLFDWVFFCFRILF